MNFAGLIHIIFAVFVWGFALIFVKPKRIKELIPIAILGFVILFISEEFLITLDLYKFNKPWIPIFGIPLFHLIWGAGSGIVVLHYMRKDFARKIIILLFFTIVTLAFEFVAESVGAATHLGKFTEIHDVFEDFIILVLLVFISEGIWGERIYSKTVN
jgi:hypothetical protein